ncbi:MAG TPA: outer membrane protein assembly factor BamD [Sedimentisphaerales bacterium]|nr:outer membrane protein assembly factor BamD [Sedimentisphaerales bacterium]
MSLKKVCLLVFIAVMVVCQVSPGETWYLKDGAFTALDSESQSLYLRDVADIKNLASMGECRELKKAVEKLKADFPDMAGEDFEAFLKADMYFCKHQYTKAIRAYDKFLEDYPQSSLFDAALERQYQIGSAYLNGEKRRVLLVFSMKGYASGEKIMEKLSDMEGDSPLAINAAKEIAVSYENRSEYKNAYMQWSYISSHWPYGDIGKESLLSMGRCKHAAYKGPRYDNSNLVSARSYYEKFIVRYPEDASGYGISDKTSQITEQLAYKEFTIAQYYQRTGYAHSAEFYYKMILEKWPDSTTAEMVRRVNEN